MDGGKKGVKLKQESQRDVQQDENADSEDVRPVLFLPNKSITCFFEQLPGMVKFLCHRLSSFRFVIITVCQAPMAFAAEKVHQGRILAEPAEPGFDPNQESRGAEKSLELRLRNQDGHLGRSCLDRFL